MVESATDSTPTCRSVSTPKIHLRIHEPGLVTTLQGVSFVLLVSDKLAGLICEIRVHKTGPGDRPARTAHGTGAVG
jgi:hypothetical protein